MGTPIPRKPRPNLHQTAALPAGGAVFELGALRAEADSSRVFGVRGQRRPLWQAEPRERGLRLRGGEPHCSGTPFAITSGLCHAKPFRLS
jgi:hypothetical protein